MPSTQHQNPLTADYNILSSEGGIIEDLQTGLQWMRCSVGQVWNGRTCRDWAVWDCESDVLGVHQSCSILNPEPGTWWVKLEAITDYANVSLHARVYILDPAFDDGTVTSRSLLAQSSLANGKGSSRFYGFSVPQNAVSLEVDTASPTPSPSDHIGLLLKRRDQIELPTLSWEEARDLRVTYGGYSDWRLPTVQELNTLVYCSSGARADFNEHGLGGQCLDRYLRPTIHPSIFPNTPQKSFWTLSEYLYFDEFAWGIHFDTGAIGSPSQNRSRHVRLVRGGR